MQARRKRLGEILVEQGWIEAKDLEAALVEQGKRGGLIGTLLVDRGLLGQQALLESLSLQLGVEVARIEEGPEDPDALGLLPYAVAKRYRALPLRREGRLLHVAMAEPQNPESIQALEFATGMQVTAYLCSDQEIDIAIEQHYGMEETVEKVVQNVTREASLEGLEPSRVTDITPGGAQGLARERTGPGAGEQQQAKAPIVRLVNLILLEAVRKEASDVHFEPTRASLQVRFRIDGMLRRRMSIPKYLQQSVLSRIKVSARMDIAKKRVPQDGGIRLEVDGRRLDLRVSSLPTFYGEKIVIRLLDQTERRLTLSDLGMDPDRCRSLEACYRRPHGMILVTGPTGSGKTTTMRSILKELRSEGVNIVTVEDPVEYELEGINQVQVQREAGLTFADSLRAILRQDPNVIMVGEIRDGETAEVAFRAALTGHLVLSTLHTNDTVSTVTRLVDMGVPRFLVSSALLVVLSQRLVRRICRGCKGPGRTEELAARGLPSEWVRGMGDWQRGSGCAQCDQTGYKGRIGLFELLVVSSRIREAVLRGDGEAEIRDLAIREGMVALFEDGLDKVRKGITTPTEVLSVAQWEGTATGEGAGQGISDLEGCAPGERISPLEPDGATILFADDDPGVREAVCLLLEALSCRVIEAADGKDAWEKILRYRPDLVITDIQMPRMDGYGLLKRIRTELSTAFTPVILLTAKNRCEDRMRGFLMGGDDYLEKPFDHRELLARVKRCLERNAMFLACSAGGMHWRGRRSCPRRGFPTG